MEVVNILLTISYLKVKASNLDKLIYQSLKKLQNISKIWGSSDLEGKRIMHKTLFPDGIFYNVEKHQCLTREVNKFIELVNSVSNSCEGKKMGTFKKFLKFPSCSEDGTIV